MHKTVGQVALLSSRLSCVSVCVGVFVHGVQCRFGRAGAWLHAVPVGARGMDECSAASLRNVRWNGRWNVRWNGRWNVPGPYLFGLLDAPRPVLGLHDECIEPEILSLMSLQPLVLEAKTENCLCTCLHTCPYTCQYACLFTCPYTCLFTGNSFTAAHDRS